MKIIFRVDSSQKIGTGHVMRCLTLADALKNHGAQIEFITRNIEGNLAGFINERGYKTHLLEQDGTKNENYCFHANWLEASWQSDAKQTAELAKGADWLVIDHYAIDGRWEKGLRPHVKKIMVNDDLADRKHDCDVLLDQNFYTDFATRYNGLVPPQTRLLLSPRYAVLRDEFIEQRAKLEREFGAVKKILLSFGGADADNDTGQALAAILDYPAEIIVVAGGANMNYGKLQEMVSGRGNLTLHKSVSNMAELMSWADIAIGAGGSTSWERAVLGLPTLCWPIAENQKRIIEDLATTGAIKLSSPENLRKDIAGFTPLTLREMSQKSLVMVDGKGKERVVEEIFK